METLFVTWLIISVMSNISFGFHVFNTSEPLEQMQIIKGQDTDITEVPYQVSLQCENNHYCGGSIITKWHVLTAAHCVKWVEQIPETVTVVSGISNLKEKHESRKISGLIKHSEYKFRKSSIHDIGLIKVDKPFVFSKTTQEIQLPARNAPLPVNTEGMISGWGYHGVKFEPKKSILQSAKFWTVDQDDCKKAMAIRKECVYPTQFCAKNPEKSGVWHGDSGGPFAVNGELVGVISWMIPDLDLGSTRFPNVFTKVSEYRDWIDENIAKLDHRVL